MIPVFSAEVHPMRYGLDNDSGIILDVAAIKPNRRRRAAEGAMFALAAGDWGLAVAVRGEELRDLHHQLGEIISQIPIEAEESPSPVESPTSVQGLALADIRARYERALAVKDKGTSQDLLVALIDCVADIPGLLTEIMILRAGSQSDAY